MLDFTRVFHTGVRVRDGSVAHQLATYFERLIATGALGALPAEGGFRLPAPEGILASAERHGIEPFAYVRQLLIALSSAAVDLKGLTKPLEDLGKLGGRLGFVRAYKVALARRLDRRASRALPAVPPR